MHRRLPIVLPFVALATCDGGSEPPPADPLFPADYAATFTEVRDCRTSADHDLTHVRVFADPVALDAYTTRGEPLPDGSLLVKEEHADETCTDLVGFAVMMREEGYDPDRGDWHWQKLDADRRVTQDGRLERCGGCHSLCEEPSGFDWTCAEP